MLKIIHAVCVQDSSFGAVNWWRNDGAENNAKAAYTEWLADDDVNASDIVRFSFPIDTDEDNEPDDITEIADAYMANMPAYSDADAIRAALNAAGFHGFEIHDVRRVTL